MNSAPRTTVVGVFRDSQRAHAAILALRDAGFAGDDVSYLAPDASESVSDAQVGGAKAAGTTTGAAIGGGLGALAGYLVGLGSLAIPGIGPFIAAGVLATSIGGLAAGAAGGAIVGYLSGEGMTADEASWYEREVRAGASLVAVRAAGRTAEAQSLLRHFGAYDVENRAGGAVAASRVREPGQIPNYSTDAEQIAGQATGQVPPIPAGGLLPSERGQGRV
jgi:hypothetical protein